MASNPKRMHELYHLPSISQPDAVSDPDMLYCPNTHFDLYPCSPPCSPTHEQCMYTKESLLLKKTSSLYLASLSHIVLLPPLVPSTLTLHQKLCGSFHKECVTCIWATTLDSQQPVITKIFNPLYFIDPYKGTDPFLLLNLSVSHEAKAYHWLAPLQSMQVLQCLGLFILPLPSQGNCAVYILLLKHVPGQDVCYLVPAHASPSLCLAHRSAIVDAAINVFYEILMCGIKQHNMAPQNLTIWPPTRGGVSAPFCDKEDCPVHFAIDPENVESVMIDFEGLELWDPDHKFYDEQMRKREMCMLREDYMEDLWYLKYRI